MLTDKDVQKLAEVFPTKKDIDQRFDTVDKKFNDIDQRFDTVDKKFNDIDQRFDTVDKRFDAVASILVEKADKTDLEQLPTREDFSNLQTAVDGYAKKADGYFQEMLMLAHKVDQHERWLKQIADKVGVRLEI